MTGKRIGENAGIRYSEAFKLQVVREVEDQNLPMEHVRRKYGVRALATVMRWLRKYGRGDRGKVVRVQKAEEINELAALKKRVRQLEALVADSQVDLAIERATAKLLAQRAGVQDVEEFKKKALGA